MLPREAPGAERAARNPARTLTARAAYALAIAGLVALVAGCGDDEEPADEPAAAGDGTEITVTLDPDGTGREPRIADVTCADDASPDEPPECEAVAALADDAAAPVPAGVACTQIYGGPDVVRLEGTLRGEDVDTELTRENGCEIERFDGFLPLLEELFEGYRPGQALGP